MANQQQSYLAIIPARGGSKGIPGKNIRMIAGKPLIAWSIEQALACPGVDRVIVSTDSTEIQQVALEYGAEAPFLRPDELATDEAGTEPALTHCLAWLAEHENYIPDAVMLLQATSPIRADNALSDAIQQFEQENADSLLSVVPFWHFLWQNPQKPTASYDYLNRPRRQDIPAEDIRYKENGSIYITKTSLLIANDNRLAGNISLFIMDEQAELEIDTLLEFDLVEQILKSER